ncbi:MAG: response regulator [Polyangiaceae bacterium]|nr:response regulator [Polyangiaceae bacterium]
MHLRVLVADDDPELLGTVASTLSESGADVVRASTGAELLEGLAERGPFDLVITDISMPWMTGLQVAHSAREAGLDVPLIVMTGLRDASIAERVGALGERVALLKKPFDYGQLTAAIAKLVPDAEA